MKGYAISFVLGLIVSGLVVALAWIFGGSSSHKFERRNDES